jgi:hypothetical protein
MAEQGSTSSVFRRWPNWLRRGGITPEGNLYCPSWGLNCASFGADAFLARGLLAPGPRSKFHDPELTELARKINDAFRELARKKKGRMIGLLLLDEGVCLTWETPRPDLEGKSDEEIRQYMSKGTDLEALTARERQALFDLPATGTSPESSRRSRRSPRR